MKPEQTGIPKKEWPRPCRDCGEQILLVVTDNGKYIPLDFKTEPSGKWLWRRMADGRYSKFTGSTADSGRRYHSCKNKGGK